MTATSPYLNHPVRTEREAVLEAENKRMREALERAGEWFQARLDGNATGGTTLERLRDIRATLAALSPTSNGGDTDGR